jgi:cell division protein FtsB
MQARAEALVNRMKARPWLHDRRVNALRQRTQELKAEEDALRAETEMLKRQTAALIALGQRITTGR